MEPAMHLAHEDGRRQPHKVAFTVAILNALKPPATDRVWLYDAKVPALAFMVTDKGNRSFYLYKRVNGRPQRIRLGGFPDITIDQARRMATKLNGEIAEGNDPQEKKRKARAAATFREVFEWYMDNHAKPKKRTWAEDQAKYDRHLKDWANRKAGSITHEDVQALHTRVGKTSPGAANRLLALLSCVFNVARINPNPAKGIERFPEHSRERFLQPEEMPKLFAAMAKLDQVWQDFFTLCLLTGQRRRNVLSMAWSELNLEGTLWKIPAEKFKTNHPQVVPLVPEAIAILKRRQAEQKAGVESLYVFPARTGKTGYLSEPKKPWDLIRQESGLTDLRIHDLRRSLGSWQAATGANLSVIGKTLGHTNTQTTAIYARLNLDPVRESVNKATAAMMAAAKPKKKRGKGGKQGGEAAKEGGKTNDAAGEVE
ncbi:MAG: tyrosine-type recombinase/integrase [Bacillota bacterium]